MKAPKPGVYRDVPPDEYHRWEAASNSALGHLMKTPAHMKTYMAADYKETDALLLGRAIHAAVLEPERFEEEYGVFPGDMDRRNKKGKQFVRQPKNIAKKTARHRRS